MALDEGGTWTTVATEVGQYRDHEQLFAFTPASATGVRVSVSEVDFGGYYGGGYPAVVGEHLARARRSSTPSRCYPGPAPRPRWRARA